MGIPSKGFGVAARADSRTAQPQDSGWAVRASEPARTAGENERSSHADSRH